MRAQYLSQRRGARARIRRTWDIVSSSRGMWLSIVVKTLSCGLVLWVEDVMQSLVFPRAEAKSIIQDRSTDRGIRFVLDLRSPEQSKAAQTMLFPPWDFLFSQCPPPPLLLLLPLLPPP
jgi:hypothetical protein